MHLTIYTDGTSKDDKAVAVSLLIQDDRFIDIVVNKYTHKTSYVIEVLGVLQALEYLEESTLNPTSITIYCDLLFAVKTFNKIIKLDYKVPYKLPNRELWVKIAKLAKGRNISIHHVKGHTLNMTGTFTCDLYGRLIREQI